MSDTQEIVISTSQAPAARQEAKPAVPQKAPIAMSEHGMQLRSMEELWRFSNMVLSSGLAPKSFDTAEKIAVATQMGMELGLSPMQALQSIAVINGRPSIWGDGALALIQSHPEFEDISESIAVTGEVITARCEVKRKGKTPTIREFSTPDAKKAGLWGKTGPWTQYPQRMLQMRARSWAIRDAFADALRGVGIREELQDVEIKPAVAREVSTLKFEEVEE